MRYRGSFFKQYDPVRSYRFQEKFFPFFVQQERRILAGGENFGAEYNLNSRPGRAPDRSFGLAPFRGWKSFGAGIPVVSQPANVPRRLRRVRNIFLNAINGASATRSYLTLHSRRGETFSHKASDLRCTGCCTGARLHPKNFPGVRQYAISVFADWKVMIGFFLLRM